MARCKWCGAEITGTEALCDKCKTVAKPKKAKVNTIRCCKCGKEEKITDKDFDKPYKCAACLKSEKEGYIVIAVIVILFIAMVIGFIALISGDDNTKGTCCICRNKAEYQFQGDDYCKKHFNMAVNDTLNN